jgi:hypothetical protein
MKYTKNKHICILNCYQNYEHILKCFESIENLNFDFFIVENFSEYSDKIYEYFHKKNLIGYIQFEKNIANNAMNIIKKDFKNLFNSYEYITFSDCDLYSENSVGLFDEIYKILELDEVGVCCSKLSKQNLPNVPGSNTWLPKPISIEKNYIDVNSGIHFMTMKNKTYKLLEDLYFLDSTLSSKIRNEGLRWVTTINNEVIHLTWDLYYDGNSYYEFKKNNRKLWNQELVSGYKILI